MESFGQKVIQENYVDNIIEAWLPNGEMSSYYSALLFDKQGKYIKAESFDR